jgi:hypothetical protein
VTWPPPLGQKPEAGGYKERMADALQAGERAPEFALHSTPDQESLVGALRETL